MAVRQLPMLVAWVRFPPPAPKLKQGVKLMYRFIRYFLKFLLALSLVGTLSLIGLITLVDPNQFKAVIEKRLSQATGQILSIQGPLSWHLTPTLSLQAEDLCLKRSSTDLYSEQKTATTLTLQKIRFVPKLWSMLSQKPSVNIQLDGLALNLRQSLSMHSLLDNIQAIGLFQIIEKVLPFWILPEEISLKNATLHWQDAITHQERQFKNISLLAEKIPSALIGNHAQLNVHFTVQDTSSEHTGDVSFKARWAFNAKAQQLDIQDLACHTNFPDLPFQTLLGTFQIHRLQNVPIIAGSFEIPNLNLQYALSNFHLPADTVSAKHINLKGTFAYQTPTLAVTAFNVALENEGHVSGSFKTELWPKTLKMLNLKGSFVGKNLRIGTLPIPNIQTTLQANHGLFIFDQIKAQLANSNHQGKIEVNLQNDLPYLTIADEMDSFEINELLARLHLKDKIYGNLKAKLNLTTQGNSPEAWLEHLSGKAYVHLREGRVRGIDLSPLLRHAQSTLVMLKDTLSKRNSTNVGAILTAELGEWRLQAMHVDLLVTPFRHLETNITFDNGRAYTADFKLTHPEYTVNGHGMVDLMQKNVEYQALALLTHPKQHASEVFSLFLKETPLGIQIKGPFNNLSIQPNLAHYADGAINLVNKAPAEPAAAHTLEKLFGFP